MKKEPNITERQAREIVEKMGRREPYTSKSIDDFYRSIGLEPEEPELSGKTVTEEAEIPMVDEPLEVATGEAAIPQKRISSKQRRLSLDAGRDRMGLDWGKNRCGTRNSQAVKSRTSHSRLAMEQEGETAWTNM